LLPFEQLIITSMLALQSKSSRVKSRLRTKLSEAVSPKAQCAVRILGRCSAMQIMFAAVPVRLRP
jgi:hypothetical protein